MNEVVAERQEDEEWCRSFGGVFGGKIKQALPNSGLPACLPVGVWVPEIGDQQKNIFISPRRVLRDGVATRAVQ